MIFIFIKNLVLKIIELNLIFLYLFLLKHSQRGLIINNSEEFVKNWNTPMIIMHGGKDYRVPLTEGLSAFTSLKLKGIDSKLVYCPKENHWVLKPENQIIWFREIIDWFNKYVSI